MSDIDDEWNQLLAKAAAKAPPRTEEPDADTPLGEPERDESPTRWERDERTGRYSEIPTEHFADDERPRSRSGSGQSNQVSIAHQTRLVEETEHVRDALRGIHHQMREGVRAVSRLHDLASLVAWLALAFGGTAGCAAVTALVVRYLVWG